MFAVIGLGNPGKQYVATRHNVGFRVIEILANRVPGGAPSWKAHGGARIARGVPIGGQDAIVIQPQQFMNRSGEAVRPVLDFFRIAPEHIIVVYDELDLEPGIIRLRLGGSSGGHRGLEDLLQHLPSGDFFRVRVGIGHPRRRAPDEIESRQDVPNYVLGAPRGTEREILAAAEERAADAVEVLVREGLSGAQHRFHTGDEIPVKPTGK